MIAYPSLTTVRELHLEERLYLPECLINKTAAFTVFYNTRTKSVHVSVTPKHQPYRTFIWHLILKIACLDT